MLTGITLILIIFDCFLLLKFYVSFKNCKIYITSLSHPNAHKNERQSGWRKESLMRKRTDVLMNERKKKRKTKGKKKERKKERKDTDTNNQTDRQTYRQTDNKHVTKQIWSQTGKLQHSWNQHTIKHIMLKAEFGP